jgi:SAM-dependent methyltransferase
MNTSPQTAQFVVRSTCIACGSADLEELSSGRFDEGPLAAFIDQDPWGEHPAPFLRGQRWSYVRCRQCAQAFHRNILDPAWNERRFAKWMSQAAIEAFAKTSRTPDNLMRQGQEYVAHVLRLHELSRDLRGADRVRILDFGCGYGEFLQACGLFGFDAHGVDRSSAKRDHGRVAIHASLDEVPEGRFHALTLFQVLEHLDDPLGILRALSSRVVPGGLLVLETPDCSGVTDITDLNAYRNIHPLEHINGFTPETMTQIAKRAGFSPVAKPPVHVTTRWVKVARGAGKYLLGRKTTEQYFRKHPGAGGEGTATGTDRPQ